MPNLPEHVRQYLQTSQYRPFTDEEVALLADAIDRGDPTDEASVELGMLMRRAALERTPRSIAIFNNAIKNRRKASGVRAIGPVCPCGSYEVHYDIDGPDPLQRVCDSCGGQLSAEQIRAAVDAAIGSFERLQ